MFKKLKIIKQKIAVCTIRSHLKLFPGKEPLPANLQYPERLVENGLGISAVVSDGQGSATEVCLEK